MEKYEILSESCKLMWRENFELNGEKYTQVSGYIFNNENYKYSFSFAMFKTHKIS